MRTPLVSYYRIMVWLSAGRFLTKRGAPKAPARCAYAPTATGRARGPWLSWRRPSHFTKPAASTDAAAGAVTKPHVDFPPLLGDPDANNFDGATAVRRDLAFCRRKSAIHKIK